MLEWGITNRLLQSVVTVMRAFLLWSAAAMNALLHFAVTELTLC